MIQAVQRRAPHAHDMSHRRLWFAVLNWSSILITGHEPERSSGPGEVHHANAEMLLVTKDSTQITHIT